MSFQFMPLYTGDYLRDTQHLDCSEHGIYCLLLMHCWDQKGPVPLDERKQLGISRARSGGEIEALRRVVAEVFIKTDDGWYNKRMAEEVAKAEKLSGSRREAGIKSAETRRKLRSASAEQVLNKCSTSAGTPTPTPTPTTTTTPIPTPTQIKTPLSGKPDARSSLREDAKQILDYLNGITGRKFRPVDANLVPIMARLRSKATVVDCYDVINDKWEQWKSDERMAEFVRPKTLFSATNFEQYFGNLPEEQS